MTSIIILISLFFAGLLFFVFLNNKRNDDVEVAKPYRPKVLTEEEQKAYQYSCVYNSLVLFANSVDYLKGLAAPAFDPLMELESEYDIGFTDFTLEENFANGTIKENLKQDLLDFRKSVKDVPSKLWNFEDLETHEIWKNIRTQANSLLTKMGEKRREYDDGFTTIIYIDK